MKTILVAVDLSPVSAQVVKAAADIAKPLGAKIILFHALSPVSSCVPIGATMDITSIPIPPSEEEIQEAETALTQLAASISSEDLPVTSVVKITLPIEGIHAELEATQATLLVIGSHGHGGLYHLFNGSVVTSLLKEATRPVLVIPVRAAA